MTDAAATDLPEHSMPVVLVYCLLSLANVARWFLLPEFLSFLPGTLFVLCLPTIVALTSSLLFAWGYWLVSRGRSGKRRRRLVWASLLLSALPLVHIMVLASELTPPR